MKISLSFRNIDIDVFIAMRYWKPLTEETVNKIEEGDYDKIILLPLYPHFSVSTTGSSFNEWKRFYKGDQSKVDLYKILSNTSSLSQSHK